MQSQNKEKVMQNLKFMTMAERFAHALMQDTSMSSMLGSLNNPAHKEQLEEQIASIKEDPSLKPILDETESGDPAAMLRFEDVLQKLGGSMGFVVAREAGASTKNVEEETQETSEDESVFHQTVSVGDIEEVETTKHGVTAT